MTTDTSEKSLGTLTMGYMTGMDCQAEDTDLGFDPKPAGVEVVV